MSRPVFVRHLFNVVQRVQTGQFQLAKRAFTMTSPLPQSSKYDDDFKKVENYQQIAELFFHFTEEQKDQFVPATLKNVRQGHQSAAYGGLIFAQAMAASEKTVDDRFTPHSVHSYFINNVDTHEPLTYHVRRIRDGKSFATRTVDAIQNGQTAFVLQVSFHVEERDSIVHQSEMPDVPPPEDLMSMRDAVPYVKKMIEKGEIAPPPAMLWRLNQYDSRIYSSDSDLFEMRSTNLGNYYGFASDRKPHLYFWMRARGDLEDNNKKLHRWLIAYNTDSVLGSTALSPHYANKFQASMVFSLDHCVWFHKNEVKADDWLLFETKSNTAGNGRAFVDGRVWKRDGTLVASCHQELIIRTRGDPSHL